ncbi:hypothetical protein ACUXZJ_09855 [Flavobacterium sp. TN-1]
MKTKLGIVLVVILFFNSLNGQILSKEVRNDFCRNAIVNAYFGSGSLKSWIIVSAQRLGYKTPLEIESAVRSLCSNVTLQNEILNSIDRLGGSREFKEQQFLSIGMTPKNSKLISDYLLLKRNNEQKNTPNVENFDYNFVKDSIVIDKKDLLRSIPKSKFTNDSTAVLRKQFVTYTDGKDGEIEYKTSVLKEYYYIGENNENHDDEERVNVVLLSEYNGKNAFLETLIFNILNNGKDYQNIRNRRLDISSRKLNNSVFKTIKEKGYTFFTIEYLDEDNSRKIDYYSPLDLNYLKTVIKEEVVQKETINKVVPKKNTTNTNLGFLKKYNGKYTYEVKLLSNPTLKKRIVDLIGNERYNYMKTTWRVEGGITVENNMFDASGCEQHNCGNTNFIIVVDLEKDILYIGYRVENEILKFGEDQNYPKLILDWESENIKGE